MLQTGRGPCKGGGESAGGNEGHCPEAPQVDINYPWGWNALAVGKGSQASQMAAVFLQQEPMLPAWG